VTLNNSTTQQNIMHCSIISMLLKERLIRNPHTVRMSLMQRNTLQYWLPTS